MPRTRIEYGPEPQQFGHFYAPEGAGDGPVPVVMVIHGGYWSGQYHLNLGTSFAVELARSGVAVWNIEYRRVGESGGGWPNTGRDVVDAIRALDGPVRDALQEQDVDLRAIDFSSVGVVGHSAGGQLAVWAVG